MQNKTLARALPYAVTTVLILLAFGTIVQNDFVYWDDDANFINNLGFRGLSWDNLRWAWHTQLLSVYQPIAWMILELEYVIGGLNPRVYHASSLALYALLIGLCIATFRQWRDYLWPRDAAAHANEWASIAILLLFALHPLRVEVVAWASCQPYIVCAIFYVLGINAYLRWRKSTHGRFWAATTVLCYGLCIGSKAIGISLPLVLLALDYFPLRRGDPLRCVYEKLPMWILMCMTAMYALTARGSALELTNQESTSPLLRLAIFASTLGLYVSKTLMPVRLSNFYPLPVAFAELNYGYLVLGLGIIPLSVVVWLKYKKASLSVGMMMLAAAGPTLGFVRVTQVLGADRYTLLPSLLLSLVLALGIQQWSNRQQWHAAFALLIVFVAGLSYQQARVWHNSRSLWEQAIAVAPAKAPSMAVAHAVYADYLKQSNAFEEAAGHLHTATQLHPTFSAPYVNLALLLAEHGQADQAQSLFEKAIELEPTNALFIANLAGNFGRLEKWPEAEQTMQQALAALTPQSPNDLRAQIHFHLGIMYARRGAGDLAEQQFIAALQADPTFTKARQALTQLTGHP